LQLGDDQERGDFRFHGHVSRDENDGAVFSEGPGESQGESGEKGRPQYGQDDAEEGLEAGGSQGGRGLLEFLFEILQHRLNGAHDERQADEDHGHYDSYGSIGDLDAEIRQRFPQPAVDGENGRERDARHRRGQGEGQIHQGVQNAFPLELVARQHPGDQEADKNVYDRGDESASERDAERGEHPGRGHDAPEFGGGQGSAFQEQAQQRNEHDQGQIEQGIAQTQPETGQYAAL